MKLLSIQDIQNNLILGKSLYASNTKLILGAGYRLTQEIKNQLVEQGYKHIYIIESEADDVIPEDIISDEITYQTKTRIARKTEDVELRDQFRDLCYIKLADLLENGNLSDAAIHYTEKKIIDEILEGITNAGIFFLNSVPYTTEDTYQFDHALNTTILSVLIAKKYSFKKPELLTLAAGAFLHDIGKIILEKLRETEHHEIAEKFSNEHPTFGYLLINGCRSFSPMVAQIINQHHENQDGGGYPIGLHGENMSPVSGIKRNTKGFIFRLAEICSIANAYDNMVMNRQKEKRLTPSEAIKQLLVASGTQYNKDIVKTFFKIVPFYPVGTIVKITNTVDSSLIGYSGVVVKVNESNLNKPIIIVLQDSFKKKITPNLVDTSKLMNCELELIL